MAEDYGVSLKITADTSDLDKIPQKVEQTRKEIERPVEQTVVERREPAAPVEHPVETVEVVEQRTTSVQQQEHPAETVEVVEQREAAAPVEHPAETVEVVEQRTTSVQQQEHAPETVKVNVEQPAPVKVTADTSAAQRSTASFFASFRRGVAALRTSISTVFAAFGMISFVVGGVMALVAGFQKLRDMATATSRAIQQMRFDAWIGGFNAAADAMIGKHQKIIALLKEEQDIANKAASLATMETSQDRAQEDAARNQVRSVQLASATDPREKARLEQQFASEDAEIARRRFDADKRRKLGQLDEEQSIYQSKANGAASQIGNVDRVIENQEDIVSRARKTIENGGEREKYDKVIDAAKKRIESLKDERKALEDLYKTAQREADYRGKQIEIVSKSQPSQSSSASQQLAAAQNAALDEKDRQAQADFERQQSRTAEDATFEDRMRAAQRRASAPGATETDRNAAENEQIELLRGREQEAKQRLEAAQKRLSDEFKKPVTERDEAAMSRAREDIRTADSTATSARRQREDIEQTVADRRVAAQQDYFGNLARQIESSRPKDRLTAMGLGSGVEVNREQREMANNVRDVVSICRDLLAATKDNKPAKSYAKYAP